MRYTGPKCRLCRREGVKLFLKGERCETPKCAITKRGTRPGDHLRGSKPTEYARQLREKQKAKRIYGLSEKQFSNLFKKAASSSESTANVMLRNLELRLDNALYRSGLLESRSQARQMISHGLFTVNGRVVKTPSISLRVGDQVALRTEAKANNFFTARKVEKDTSPKWMEVNTKTFGFTIEALPEQDDYESIIQSRLIVEFYSRN